MKKTLIITTSLLSSAAMAAMPVYQPLGASFTLGSSPNQRALATALGNPAAAFLMVNEQDDDSFRFGIIGPVGIGAEVGDISDLSDQVDRIEDIVDKQYGSVSAVNAAKDEAESILSNIAQTAYFKVSAAMQVPFMPIIYKTKNNGAFMLDASFSVVGRANLLDDEITPDLVNNKLTSNTSLYVKTATDLNIGLGYSRLLWQPEGDKGQLIGGVKANLHRIALGKALSVLSDDSENADDALSDTLSDDAVSSTGVGLDLGAIWVADNYQLGVTFANLNEPEFDYGAVGVNCGSKTGSQLTRCNAAASFVSEGRLSVSETYTMEMQTTIEAAVTSANKRWTLAGSYDANSVLDPVGDEYQWGVVSVSYYGDSHFLPGLRAGYRKNMAGSELSYVTGGLTLLKRLNLDIAISTETVRDSDGDETPRSAYISLGYDTAF